MSYTSWPLPLFPGYTLTVGLFLKDNSHEQNLSEFLNAKEGIIVDATIIPDLFLIQSAACRALSSLQSNALVTKSLLEELVFHLYPSNSFSLLKDFCNAPSYAFLIILSQEAIVQPEVPFLPLEMHQDILDTSRIAKVFNLLEGEYSREKHLKQCINAVVCKRV